MLKKFALGAAPAVLLLLSGVASATSITPGMTNIPVGIENGGYNLLYSATQSFSFAGNTGSVVTDVVNWTANPFGFSDITFFFQITVATGQVEHLTDASLAGAGVQLDVGQTGASSGDSLVNGNAPATGADLSIDGSIVSFDFSGAGAITATSGPSYLLAVNT